MNDVWNHEVLHNIFTLEFSNGNHENKQLLLKCIQTIDAWRICIILCIYFYLKNLVQEHSWVVLIERFNDVCTVFFRRLSFFTSLHFFCWKITLFFAWKARFNKVNYTVIACTMHKALVCSLMHPEREWESVGEWKN